MNKRLIQNAALVLLSLIFPIVLVQDIGEAWTANRWDAFMASMAYLLLWLIFFVVMCWFSLTSDAPLGVQIEDRARRLQSIRYGMAALKEMRQENKRR